MGTGTKGLVMTTTQQSQGIQQAVREQLLGLAKHEDDLACDELARVPYWAPAPVTAVGHREAARVLRQQADQLLAMILAVATP